MFKDECSKDKFKLDYQNPDDFTKCFWQKRPQVSSLYVAYRTLVVLYFLVAVLVVFTAQEEGYVWYKNFLYYTYWSYILELIAFSLALIVSLQRMVKEKKNPQLAPTELMPVRYKILWIAYTAAAPSSIVVSLLFWLFVYNPELYSTLSYTFITHVFNSVFMIIDFLLCAIPYRFLHFYTPLIFSFCYATFSVIYQCSGGTGNKGQIPIYIILDWREPRVAISTCAIQLTCILLVHSAFCVVNILKHWLKKPSEGDVP